MILLEQWFKRHFKRFSTIEEIFEMSHILGRFFKTMC